MITIKEYDNTYKNEWNLFNKQSKNGLFMFDRDYMEYHSNRFQDNSLIFYEENKILALLPLNIDITTKTLYSHQGLSFGGFISGNNMKQYKMNECLKILKQYMININIDTLIYKAIPYIYHKQAAQEDIYSLFLNKANLYRSDCSSVIYLENQYSISKGRKAQISRAKREGVIIEYSDDFENFYILLQQVLLKQHNVKATHDLNELLLLQNNFKKEIQLVVAKLNSNIIAGALIFINHNVIHTQYLAADDTARRIGALDLLINTLINEFLNTKIYFSFGISTENDGLYLNEGLIAQKEGFGARSITHNFYKLIAK